LGPLVGGSGWLEQDKHHQRDALQKKLSPFR